MPRLIAALIIFAIGWLISSWAAKSAYKVLLREEIPRSMLIARFIKAMLLLFFSALALAEIDIAREIVIIGFSTVFITLGALIVVFAATGAKAFIGDLFKLREKDD